MRRFLSRIAGIAVTLLAVTACQPSPSSGSGGGQPVPSSAPITSGGGHGGGATTTPAGSGQRSDGNFDAVGFASGQRVNCANINSSLKIRADGPVSWRAVATSGATYPWRVISEITVTPSSGTLTSGQTATLTISGAITTIQPPPDFFYLTVVYADQPSKGRSYEFTCQRR